jgi:hypothetical protein
MPVWNATNVGHLLNRTLFGYSKNDLSVAQGYGTFSDLLDVAILKDLPAPSAPNTWVTTAPAATQTTSGETGTWYREFNYWFFIIIFRMNAIRSYIPKTCMCKIPCFGNMRLETLSS